MVEIALGEPEMTVTFRVAYDGTDSAHAMDVQLLAPALLGFGELIREANFVINGDKSKVQLNVISDFEQKCFNVNFSLAQTLFEHVKNILKLEDVKSTKEILEWIGLIAGPTATIGIPLLGYLGFRRGRPIKSVTKLTNKDSRGMIQIDFGDGVNSDKITIHNHVYSLGQDKKILESVSDAIRPVLNESKYDRLEFGERDTITGMIRRTDAVDIQKSCDLSSLPSEDIPLTPQPVEAWLKILSPVFETDASAWRFWYGDQAIRVDISETDIAKNAIARGGVTIGDTYKVRMLITQHKTPTERFTNHYKITEVLEFHLARQLTQDGFL